MPKKPTKRDKKQKQTAGKVVSENRRARHEFDVLESLECGIALVGSEVKSLRAGKLSLAESYGRVMDGEVFLLGADIPEYGPANRFNHLPKRPRKLLMHRREVKRFAGRAFEKGLTLVPLKVYFNEEGRVKVLLGLCRGKQLHDKREAMRQAEAKRDMLRALRRR